MSTKPGQLHLLFEWVLSYSRWTYVSLALSETFEALPARLRAAQERREMRRSDARKKADG